MLIVDHEVCDQAVMVRAQGDIDSTSVTRFDECLRIALELARTHPARLVVADLQNVSYFGSAAINAVLDYHEQGRNGGIAVRLVADHELVLLPIEVTNLDRVLEVYPSVAAAVHPRHSETPS